MVPPSTREPLPLVLASASPRRRELLGRAGIALEVQAADIDETRRPGEAPADMAVRLASEKALHVARQVGNSPRRWVLGSDTVVVLGDEVFGKPRSDEDAVAMLGRLGGRTHTVVTGVAVADSATLAVKTCRVESRVHLRAADEAERRAYVATGEPRDKAGAYAIQGRGRALVERFEGSETNVIGLPVGETLALLRELGAQLPGLA